MKQTGGTQQDRLVLQINAGLHRYFASCKRECYAEAWIAVTEAMKRGETDEDRIFLEAIRAASRQLSYRTKGTGSKTGVVFSELENKEWEDLEVEPVVWDKNSRELIADMKEIIGETWTRIVQDLTEGATLPDIARKSGKRLPVFIKEYNRVMNRLREGLKSYVEVPV